MLRTWSVAVTGTTREISVLGQNPPTKFLFWCPDSESSKGELEWILAGSYGDGCLVSSEVCPAVLFGGQCGYMEEKYRVLCWGSMCLARRSLRFLMWKESVWRHDLNMYFFWIQSSAKNENEKRVTWLILPVVICLSQRLSHASLSISIYIVKLRKAHYISYSLFDGTLTTWITVVILELIHAQKWRLRKPWTY